MFDVACVFPGQGSQSVGMLQDFAIHYPLVGEVFAEVSDKVGYDLWHLIQHGPDTQLNQTQYTQVAMLAADVAVYRVVQKESGLQPQILAGHSLGEYAALVCAGSISLSEAAWLVSQRGRLMQETMPLGLGAMAVVIGLTDDQVTALCDDASSPSEQVVPANYNAIGQVVIAGHTAAVNKAIGLAQQQNALKAAIIPVSVPCHCPLLKEAATLFAGYLHNTGFQKPTVPIISNVDVSLYQSAENIRSLLQTQLYSPVLWVDTIKKIKQHGVDLILECGPGKVLTGLIKRIDKSLKALSIFDHKSLCYAMDQLTQ